MSGEVRTFDQLLLAAHRQCREILNNGDDPSKHAFVVSTHEELILKDQPLFHQFHLNAERSTICGMPIQVQP